MKLIIAGSRDLSPSLEQIDKETSCAWDWGWGEYGGIVVDEVVSGCARGVDMAGEAWAHARGKACQRFPADWNKHGKAAGKRRNSKMADYADMLLAFWDGDSPGTANMIANMVLREKPVRVVLVRGGK